MAQKAVERLREAGESDPINVIANEVVAQWVKRK
jgi:hypothetical protein